MSETARVILFRRSGKYYTEENWRIPEVVDDWSEHRGHYTREPLAPYDMGESPDFRRIDQGPVLITSDNPWGYPHLFVGLP